MFSIVQLSKFIEIFQKGCFRTSYVIIVAHFQYQNILYKNQKTTNRIILGSIHAFFTKSNEFLKFFLNMDQCFSCCVAVRNLLSDMYIARLLLQRSTKSDISSNKVNTLPLQIFWSKLFPLCNVEALRDQVNRSFLFFFILRRKMCVRNPVQLVLNEIQISFASNGLNILKEFFRVINPWNIQTVFTIRLSLSPETPLSSHVSSWHQTIPKSSKITLDYICCKSDFWRFHEGKNRLHR